jgi:hypothetical protein
MNCSPTINAEDFRTIHNALCEMRSVYETIQGVVREPITDKMAHAIREMEAGLAGAYEQDNKSFDAKHDHYSDVRGQLGLDQSVWSIFEVENLSDRHPFEGADRVVYTDHWGGKPVQCSINGLTWAALYIAANACIRDSGDKHHIYIEQFRPSKDDPRTLILSTGS